MSDESITTEKTRRFPWVPVLLVTAVAVGALFHEEIATRFGDIIDAFGGQ